FAGLTRQAPLQLGDTLRQVEGFKPLGRVVQNQFGRAVAPRGMVTPDVARQSVQRLGGQEEEPRDGPLQDLGPGGAVGGLEVFQRQPTPQRALADADDGGRLGDRRLGQQRRDSLFLLPGNRSWATHASSPFRSMPVSGYSTHRPAAPSVLP